MNIQQFRKTNLPDTPGVYIFRGGGQRVLYIGKATSLVDRVRSYFAKDIAMTRSNAIEKMVIDAVSLSWHETGSALEALILEAKLIKEYQPQYNTLSKDNASYNFVIITDEDFPRVLVVRGRELATRWTDNQIKHRFGPFTESKLLREAVNMIRKIFPFRDVCAPCSVGINCKPCFNAQIGICPGVCNGAIDKKRYAQTIRNIRDIFNAKFHGLQTRLTKDMKVASEHQNYEYASELRGQIRSLTHIRDVSLIGDEFKKDTGGDMNIASPFRIEGYDVSHLGGHSAVGVMTVFSNGIADKNEYRQFIIKSATNDDIKSLSEILKRRIRHTEWALPQMIVVDGNYMQINVAERILKESCLNIAVAGVTKDDRHKPREILGDVILVKKYKKEILGVNAEAHRFAIALHRKKMRNSNNLSSQ